MDHNIFQLGRKHTEGVLHFLIDFVIDALFDVSLQDVGFCQLFLQIRIVDVVVGAQTFGIISELFVTLNLFVFRIKVKSLGDTTIVVIASYFLLEELVVLLVLF